MEVEIRDISDGTVLGEGQEGEICIKGPNVMRGYLDNPVATEETFYPNRWLRSGDIGYCDDEGMRLSSTG